MCAGCWSYLHSMEFEVKAVQRLQAFIRLNIFCISQHPNVDGNLEMILLLANEGIVCQGEVEAFVSVDTVGRHRTKHGKENEGIVW